MTEKKRKKHRPKKKPGPPARPADAQKPTPENEEHDPFDFGGLPARDLKKNLGCG